MVTGHPILSADCSCTPPVTLLLHTSALLPRFVLLLALILGLQVANAQDNPSNEGKLILAASTPAITDSIAHELLSAENANTHYPSDTLHLPESVPAESAETDSSEPWKTLLPVIVGGLLATIGGVAGVLLTSFLAKRNKMQEIIAQNKVRVDQEAYARLKHIQSLSVQDTAVSTYKRLLHDQEWYFTNRLGGVPILVES